MAVEQLVPRLELLGEEYVLVQAWKKTSTYIRSHNWYYDTLALDRASVDLPRFIDELRERLQSMDRWENDPIRIVPAPKSQRWELRGDTWKPDGGTESVRLRPLGHVGLADQVVATALMLCLADRIETRQGDPTLSLDNQESGMRVVSYGNRLFCDTKENRDLHHRWGSSKLYRSYYQDYRTFLSRPEDVVQSSPELEGKRVYVIHADITQFYDRVRPELLSRAINRIRLVDDDPKFFDFLASVFNWSWDPRDESVIQMYSEQAKLEGGFAQVILPQGLVASGFFANSVLLSFDNALRAAIKTEISQGVSLMDVCRYVDDLRLVVAIEPRERVSATELKESVFTWLDEVLGQNAAGLKLSPDKTQVAALGGDERPLVLQSTRMNRIQSAVSGGFDALGGAEILDAIQGLLRAQEALSISEDNGWRFSPVPDVRDVTVARFSAGRYRTAFRSTRPLLQDENLLKELDSDEDEAPEEVQLRRPRTRRELDEDARVFACGLIKRWIDDPSNVRLLLIGLDIWPDVKLLQEILSLLRPYTEEGVCQIAGTEQVAWFCLAGILQAGATETGLIPDKESLPEGIKLESYRKELCKEAIRLITLSEGTIPWYLRQQALLFLAAYDPSRIPAVRTETEPEYLHYIEMIRFLRGERDRLNSSDFAMLAVLARRVFLDRDKAIELVGNGLNKSQIAQIADLDPSFLLELCQTDKNSVDIDQLPERVREDLCLASKSPDHYTLAAVVLNKAPTDLLRDELSILYFAKAFLNWWCFERGAQEEALPMVITPERIKLELYDDGRIRRVEKLSIVRSRVSGSGSLYEPPSWCTDSDRWRVQLGFLLRFILSEQPDFTRPVHPARWIETESAYRSPEGHWYKRQYGLYNAQSAFGSDWLPMTEWLEGFLLALLRWPGCRAPGEFGWVEGGINATMKQIEKRIDCLRGYRGAASDTLILPLRIKRSTYRSGQPSLRACVVQTVIPKDSDFQPNDLELNEVEIRQKHRRHLSAALAAVNRMLILRETHKGSDSGLDWLILPELAVHPKDVRTHLIPFAREHRAMILTGLTYERIIAGEPLVNSALWVIPEWSKRDGLQIRIRRQGKKFLIPDELKFECGDMKLLQGFRPCQWLIGYPWSSESSAAPLWLTAAVCYDATDLALVADLRNVSDVLAIPALNRDVKTFDQMAMALHYHMFQLVVVVNNGKYGGSNAYWPKRKDYFRKVFHTHGQPQATISFFDIDDVSVFLEREDLSRGNGDDSEWKTPPAG